MAHRTTTLLAFLLAGWIAPLLQAQEKNRPEAQWKIGLAEVKITPEQPLLLSGYASRKTPFEKIVGDIYAKAMAIEDSDGQRAVLVTSDLLYFNAAVADPICERIEKKTGLKREQVLLNFSHSHSGPQTTLKGGGEANRNVAYTRDLQDKFVDIVAQSLGRLQPATMAWGGGVIDFAMNRREFTPKGVILGVNPRGLTDRGVPVIRVDGSDLQPRAIVFGTAVHGTTLSANSFLLCGDFPGFAQDALRQRYPKAQSMYLLGCAGDTNPYPRGGKDVVKDLEITRQHGKALADEVGRVLDAKLQPLVGPLRVAFDRVDLPLLAHASRKELTKLAADKNHPQSKEAEQLLAKQAAGEKPRTHINCPVAVWRFGDGLTVVALSGEVVIDYVPMLEKALGPNQLLVLAYCNEVFGYLPTARLLDEGGYETRGVADGSFHASAQDVLVRKVRELAAKVGRKLPE
jgi:neutral ceramidase